MTNSALQALEMQYREIWCVDFEYAIGADLRPRPWCMVAREWKSRREIRMWREELYACVRAPFDVGPDALFVAYNVSAEMDCFLVLGWPLPCNALDLYVEYRCDTNQTPWKSRKFIHALGHYGFPHMVVEEKDEWRQKALTLTHWSPEDKTGLLDYCATDVDAPEALLPVMVPRISMPHARLRARYMLAVSRMVGTPLDAGLYQEMMDAWESIKLYFIQQDGGAYGVYEGTSWRDHLFLQWCADHNIWWPLTAEGRPSLTRETWKDRVRAHPELRALHRLHTNILDLRLHELKIADDGYNRTWLKPYWTATARNQPSASEFIYALPGWLRGLIKPPEGYGLANCDFTVQEFAVAAALSGDEAMMEGVRSGDPYLHFGRGAKLIPSDATRKTHGEIRDAKLKPLVLGQLFGMSPYGIAAKLEVSLMEARELHARLQSQYSTFYRWRDDAVTSAQFSGYVETVYGWRQRIDGVVKPRSIMNFFCQANGAEMMRIAAIAATEAGIEVCCPIHDAFLIQAPLAHLDDAIEEMRNIMRKAGERVTGGLPVESRAENTTRWPDRHPSRMKEGRDTWGAILNILRQQGRKVA
jgi:DNA polymerase I